jgi:hypothetical protein
MKTLSHAEQTGHESGEQEREPYGCAGDRARLAEQREDSRTDHRSDAEERCTADAHESSITTLRAPRITRPG